MGGSVRVLFLSVLVFLSAEIIQSTSYDGEVKEVCIERERQALFNFKQGLVDRTNRLSSWVGHDFCSWSGVGCNNRSGHVINLDLRNLLIEWLDGYPHRIPENSSLSGEINPSLLELNHLKYLDLSSNDFKSKPIPNFIGSFKKLRYLNLSFSGFAGTIPHHLGNLSSLVYLDLHLDINQDDILEVDNLHWLSGLSSLRHLDLGNVTLSQSHDWLPVINMLPSLSELRLSNCELPNITTSLPYVNFTSLSVLDLSRNELGPRIPDWLFNLSSLEYLNLEGNHFQDPIPSALGKCHLHTLVFSYNYIRGEMTGFVECPSGCIQESLETLDLSGNSLYGPIPQSLGNLSSLEDLRLHFNNLSGPIPESLGKLSSLKYLDLSWNNLNGPIPESLGKLSSLKYLDLSQNNLSGPIPESFGKLSSLKYLDLSQNNLSGPIPESLGKLSSLKYLVLSQNNLNGPIPESLGNLSSLEALHLHSNNLNGSLPESLGQLSELINIRISSNSLEGIVSEAHFASLTKLESLDISFNSLVLKVSSNWIPPFHLEYIIMRSCQVGPQFPGWLREQRYLLELDLSNAQISDSIPYWFWNLSSQISFLNLSHNQINGEIPNSLHFAGGATIDLSFNSFRGSLPHSFLNAGIWILDLSNNLLSGPIPVTFGEIFPEFLSLSHNYLNGSIPLSFCQMVSLANLDLSYNQLTGELPQCLGNLTYLFTMDLANNNIHGRFPESLGFINELKWLRLRSNNFSGELPASLRNFTDLRAIDFSENNISGKIPKWIGKSLSALKNLKLSANKFSRTIPPQLCHLTSLQILDLARNKLLGAIPRCFSNFSAMAMTEHRSESIVGEKYGIGNGDERGDEGSIQYEENITVIIKGQKLDYTSTLSLVSVIDLSSNHLSGEIPEDLASLSGLQGLNLSGNHLTGNIPKKIDGLRWLQSLDLSHNQLSGAIPQSLSALTSLISLDLSHNKLSGQIPSGNQLQTLTDPSIYSDNLDLCGPPLPKCRKDETSQTPTVEEEREEERFEKVWFFTSMAPGFVVGFWGVCGVLIFKKSWRISYYRLSDKVMDTIFVVWVTKVAKLKTMLRG